MKTGMVVVIEQDDLEQTRSFLPDGKIALVALCIVLLIISYKTRQGEETHDIFPVCHVCSQRL